MALKWIEGFEWLSGAGVGDELAVKYPEGWAATSWVSTDFLISTPLPATRNGGNGLLTTQADAFYLETPAFTAQATWIVGFAFYVEKFETATPTSEYVLEFVDGSTVHVRVTLASGAGADSASFLIENGDGTDLGTTSAFSSGQWYYVEFKVTIDDSTGSVTVNIDGVEDLALTGGWDTRNGGNASADRIRLYTGWNDGADDLCLDDWYVCDNTGSTNNNFLGDSHVEGILPSAAGTSTGWTPNTGANYAAVDDTDPDEDTSYVEEDTATGKDLYTYGNLTRISANIKGVQVNAYGRNTNASTARTIKTTAYSSGTEANGANKSFVGVAWSVAHGVFEVDPNTSTAWDVAGINAAEFGMEFVS